MPPSSLLASLLLAGEKAANIARKCRENEYLVALLVEEKHGDAANPRFVRDFKTLADVLIQETLKHDIGNQYPEMRDNIKGEEDNMFCNALGESICVRVLNTPTETAALLAQVLNGDAEAARLLAEEVHRDVRLTDVTCVTRLPHDGDDEDVDRSQLGVWIDPIDSTAEYISGGGEAGEDFEADGIATRGLQCVTVLLGCYDLRTGDVRMGVVNQPFATCIDSRWRGKCYWGVCHPVRASSLLPTCDDGGGGGGRIVCLSGSESEDMKERLRAAGYVLVEAAGAGNKLLAVMRGAADAYVLSKSTTFKWDACGPHAVLKSLGGDTIVYDDAVHADHITTSLTYGYDASLSKTEACCNRGGIIAYRNPEVMKHIVDLLSDLI